jgi:flagellar biosynthesis protein FliP
VPAVGGAPLAGEEIPHPQPALLDDPGATQTMPCGCPAPTAAQLSRGVLPIHPSLPKDASPDQLTMEQAAEEAGKPLKVFLSKFVREKDVAMLLEISKTPAPAKPTDLDLKILVPAYVLSELKAGFQIGAVLFLPFLIIDLVVASLTLSIGMVQLPPVMLSAPFKVLLFVLVDGWNLVVGSLVRSFG